MGRPIDWRAAIRRHARAEGVTLPQTAVDEMAVHLEDLYSAARADGASPDDATARVERALRESAFPELQPYAARHPDRHRARVADLTAAGARHRSLSMSSALRIAFRQFRHHPAFALMTVLVLGLGTAAAATVYTVVDSVVLRPLPYRQPDRLVTLWATNSDKALAHDPISPVNFMDYRDLPAFSDAAAWWRPGVNLVDPGLDPVRVKTIEVSANLFSVLGVKPQLGAGFPDDGPFFSPDLAAVISDRLWRTRYNADPAIIGRQLSLNSTPYTVLGVMPPDFHYPDDIDVWERLRWDLHNHSRAAHFMESVLRLSDDATLDQAQTAVATLGARLQKDFPSTNTGWSARLVPLLDEQLGYYRPALMVLFGAVGLLLLIGVLNVASLLLTRALSRDREIAVRVAIGAAPRQLVTQLLAESFVLSIAGALTGLVVAALALPLIRNLTPVDIPRLADARLNLHVLGFCVGIVAGATVVFGLVPALLLLRRQVATDLKTAERGSSRGGRRTYSLLVAAEVALACALLVSSALLVRTVGRMMDTPTGVDADDVLTTTVQLTVRNAGARVREPWQEAADMHSRILEVIRLQPGVTAAGASNFLPLEVGWRAPFYVQGAPPPARPEDADQAQLHSASEGYFEAMGATLLDGRSFATTDRSDTAGVVVVNETFARRYLASRRAVGQVVRVWATGMGPLGVNLEATDARMPDEMPFEVVGVVKDIRDVPLGQTVEPAIYFTTRQFPFSEVFIAVRAATFDAGRAAVREALRKVAPTVPMANARTWGDRMAERTGEARLLMDVLVFFGALAGLLAAVGVYGLFSWSVALRRRELAIRMTLGARPATVGTSVLRQSAILIVLGLAAGLAFVELAQGALRRVLFEVSPNDPRSMLLAGGVLLLAALAACVPPAVRAMRIDPVEGLRTE